MKIYWLLPGKILEDGLRVIAGDHDINVMYSVVHRYKNLVVYFDHEDNIGGVDWDDIVVNPVASLLKVFSPKKVEVVNKAAGEKLLCTDLRNIRVEQNVTASTEEHVDAGGGEDIFDNDSEDDDFVDSDYELDDDDDDLFKDFIGGDVDEGLLEKRNKKIKGSRLKSFHTSRPEQMTDEDTDEEVLDIPN